MFNNAGCMNMSNTLILDLNDGKNTVFPCFRNSESGSLMASNLRPNAQLPITSVEYLAIISRISIFCVPSSIVFPRFDNRLSLHSFTYNILFRVLIVYIWEGEVIPDKLSSCNNEIIVVIRFSYLILFFFIKLSFHIKFNIIFYKRCLNSKFYVSSSRLWW